MKNPQVHFFFYRFLPAIILILLLLYIFGGRDGLEKAKENSALQKARDLEVTLFQYAQDNNGQYPDGKSSTEIFQKLLDGGYLVDSEGSNKPIDLAFCTIPCPVK